MGSYGIFDPLILVPLVGGFIGMAVGLVTIWTSIKTSRREQKHDIEASNKASEGRIKEFLELKLQVIETKFEQSNLYFREWIQRIEKEVHDSK